ncbi:MAG TPA: hypothetical protein VD902_19755, partial [Symbiobacteriaceae bacterium]|nr:hypothetical protein [Symbiobacteriaceae bacterium]
MRVVIVLVMAVLTVSLSGCGKASKEPEVLKQHEVTTKLVEPLPEGLVHLTPDRVEYVRYHPGATASTQVLRPLFGGRAEDREALQRLFKAMGEALVTLSAGPDTVPKGVPYHEIRMKDGRSIRIRHVVICP